MPHILRTETEPDRMPRLAWVEAEGTGEIRLSVSDPFGRSGSGKAAVGALEELGRSSTSALLAGDMWLERVRNTEVWSVVLLAQPDLGPTHVHTAEILGALNQVEFDRLLEGAYVRGANSKSTEAAAPC